MAVMGIFPPFFVCCFNCSLAKKNYNRVNFYPFDVQITACSLPPKYPTPFAIVIMWHLVCLILPLTLLNWDENTMARTLTVILGYGVNLRKGRRYLELATIRTVMLTVSDIFPSYKGAPNFVIWIYEYNEHTYMFLTKGNANVWGIKII